MTRDETKKILLIMDATFVNFKVEPAKLGFMIDTWTIMLEEYSYDDVVKALKNYILTDVKGFAPAIGQLVEMIHKSKKLEQGEELNEMEAWYLVHKAICNSNYNSKEEYSRLPKLVQKAVGTPANLREMAVMEDDTVMSVEQSHFIRNYRAELEKEKLLAKMPEEQRRLIQEVSDKLKIESEG